MEEFNEVCQWYTGWVTEKGNNHIDSGSFVEIEYKYFEGMNPPIKIINGKPEPIEESINRVKRWFEIPLERRMKIQKQSWKTLEE